MEINEHIIKFSGSVNVPVGLQMDADVVLLVKGAVMKTEELSNQDGTINRRATVKIIAVEVK